MSSDAEKVGGHTNSDSQEEHVLGLALEEVGDRKSPAAGFPSLSHVAIGQPRLSFSLSLHGDMVIQDNDTSCYDLNSRDHCRSDLIF